MLSAFEPSWVHGPEFHFSGNLGRGLLSLYGQQSENKQAGARQALAEKGEKASEDEAGARLKQSYDSLAQDKEMETNRLAVQKDSTKAAQQLKQSQQNLLNQYRHSEVLNQKQRIKDASKKARSAADALTHTHKETAAFMADSKKRGNVESFLAHPDADKTVVTHMFNLEERNNNPTETETTTENNAGSAEKPGTDAYNPSWLGKLLGRQATPAIPGTPAVLPSRVTTRRTLTPAQSLQQGQSQRSATSPPPPSSATKPQTATNAKTGQKLQLINGKWQPIAPPQ